MTDAVIDTDRNGTIRFINDAATSLTGWPAYAAVGLPLGRVFRVHVSHRLAACPTSVLLSRNGQAVPIEGRAEAVRNRAGDLEQVRLHFAPRFTTPASATSRDAA
jgi:PAS domain-containing protein